MLRVPHPVPDGRIAPFLLLVEQQETVTAAGKDMALCIAADAAVKIVRSNRGYIECLDQAFFAVEHQPGIAAEPEVAIGIVDDPPNDVVQAHHRILRPVRPAGIHAVVRADKEAAGVFAQGFDPGERRHHPDTPVPETDFEKRPRGPDEKTVLAIGGDGIDRAERFPEVVPAESRFQPEPIQVINPHFGREKGAQYQGVALDTDRADVQHGAQVDFRQFAGGDIIPQQAGSRSHPHGFSVAI